MHQIPEFGWYFPSRPTNLSNPPGLALVAGLSGRDKTLVCRLDTSLYNPNTQSSCFYDICKTRIRGAFQKGLTNSALYPLIFSGERLKCCTRTVSGFRSQNLPACHDYSTSAQVVYGVSAVSNFEIKSVYCHALPCYA